MKSLKYALLGALLAVLLSVSYAAGLMVAEQRTAPLTVSPAKSGTVTIKPVFDVKALDIATKMNEQRVANNLPALAYQPQLEASACAKADDMIARNYWSHDTPDGVEPYQFFTNAGYDYYHGGENLAYNQRTSQQVVDNWMGSPSHRANILGDFYEQGVCVRIGKYMNLETTALIVAHYGIRN